MTISESILIRIKKADLSKFHDVTRFDLPMDAGLWALWVLQDYFKMDDRHFTSNELSMVLLKRKVSFSEKEITRGFTRAGKKIDRKLEGKGNHSYMIMESGKDYLRKLHSEDNIAVIYVDGKNQHTDYEKFSDLINNTKGEVKIVDKFYSRFSLDIIKEFDNNRTLKLLSAKIAIGEDLGKFQLALQRFRSEYKNVQIRIHSREFELHDRYIITDDSFILLGRGLQDISGKESFVIALKKGVADDIKGILSLKFDERWTKASNLK